MSTQSQNSSPVDISAILRERRVAANHKRERAQLFDSESKKEKDEGKDQRLNPTLRPSSPPDAESIRKGRKSEEIATYTSGSLTRSRNLLLETVNRSSSTLEHLGYTSSKIIETNEDLTEQGSTISTSKSLLGKYGRREWTDRLLIFLAFLMFLGVVLYILQKRFL